MPDPVEGRSADRTTFIPLATIILVTLIFVIGSLLSCVINRQREFAAARRAITEEEAWETGFGSLGLERRQRNSLPS